MGVVYQGESSGPARVIGINATNIDQMVEFAKELKSGYETINNSIDKMLEGINRIANSEKYVGTIADCYKAAGNAITTAKTEAMALFKRLSESIIATAEDIYQTEINASESFEKIIGKDPLNFQLPEWYTE